MILLTCIAAISYEITAVAFLQFDVIHFCYATWSASHRFGLLWIICAAHLTRASWLLANPRCCQLPKWGRRQSMLAVLKSSMVTAPNKIQLHWRRVWSVWEEKKNRTGWPFLRNQVSRVKFTGAGRNFFFMLTKRLSVVAVHFNKMTNFSGKRSYYGLSIS